MKKAARAAGKDDQQSLIERLRKTDTDFYTTGSEDYQNGVLAGEAWVREKATARYLRNLESLWESRLRAAVERDEEGSSMIDTITFEEHDVMFSCTTVSAQQRFVTKSGRPDHDEWPRQYSLGFFDGAVALWRSVKSEVPDPGDTAKSKGTPKKKSQK